MPARNPAVSVLYAHAKRRGPGATAPVKPVANAEQKIFK
jgi:hypothetical protein